MNFSLSCLLAWRYLTSKNNTTITTMIGICFAGIFVGTCALALIASIMRGFEYETHKKLQSIYPSLVIAAPEDTTLEVEPLRTYLKQHLGTSITESSPYIIKEAVIHPATVDNPTLVVLLKGIDPRYENEVTHYVTMVTPSSACDVLKGQNVIIGKMLAEKLNVTIDETAVLLCNENNQGAVTESSLCSIPITVVGIITTGIADYDESLIISSLDLCKKIWGVDCVSSLGIGLNSSKEEKKVVEFLKAMPDFTVTTWQERNPGIVSALKLEQYVMILILFLICVVASMNLISLLFMYITAKQTDAALLRMLGMTITEVSTIFLLVSLLITMCATGCGLLAAYCFGKLLQWYPCITLPDAYYITYLPVRLEWPLFALIAGATILLALLASLLPLRIVRNRSITTILRSE